jgi:hypothetical protein
MPAHSRTHRQKKSCAVAIRDAARSSETFNSALGGQLHERLGVVSVAVFLCHELDGVKQDLQGRQTLLSIDH